MNKGVQINPEIDNNINDNIEELLEKKERKDHFV
jgi:hypothetical protein